MSHREFSARYVAPVVFLLAMTGIVLLVRTSLRADTRSTPTPTVSTTAPGAAVAPSAPARSERASYYVIASGDTLGAIAARFATTVDALLRLNPGIEPTALTPGEQVRVK